jgi:hypothetical protein
MGAPMTEEPQGILSHQFDPKLYVVSVNYPGSPDDSLGILPRPDLVDKALSPISDWVRLNGFTWLVWSGLSTEVIAKHIQNEIGENGRILVLRASQHGIYGWQPDWVWKWIADRKTAPQAGLGPPSTF